MASQAAAPGLRALAPPRRQVLRKTFQIRRQSPARGQAAVALYFPAMPKAVMPPTGRMACSDRLTVAGNTDTGLGKMRIPRFTGEGGPDGVGAMQKTVVWDG